MAREDPQFKLRMTEEIKDRIAAAAEKSGRSMNAEILARLEWSFEAEAGRDIPKLDESKLEHFAILLAEQLKLKTMSDFSSDAALSGSKRKKK